MSKKTWKYHTSLTFKHEGENHSVATQLYQTGVYAIFDNNPSMQQAFGNPEPIVKMEKKFIADNKTEKITDLVFGREIAVTTNDDGFLIAV